MTTLHEANLAYSVIIPAAGIGSRFHATLSKQYAKIDHKCVLEHTIDCFLVCPGVQHIIVVLHADDQQWFDLPCAQSDRIKAVRGGDHRAESVLNGLRYLETITVNDQWVLVHDACRPFITADDVQRLVQAVAGDEVGGILAVPATDTLKSVSPDHRIQQTVARDTIWCAQTPQMFRLAALKLALEQALAAGRVVTDEASAMEWMGWHPLIVMGNVNNKKVTYLDDLDPQRV